MEELGERSIEELIEELQRARERGESERARGLEEDIIRRSSWLVETIAREFTNSGEPLEDLVQAGYIGLLNAIHNFDLSRGTKFNTYASHLIRGEIRHYIRDKHGMVRVPQWLKALNRRIDEVREEFYKRHGRFPTLGELAEGLNMTEEGLREALKARDSVTYVSIDRERRELDPHPEIDFEKIRSLRDDPFPWEERVRIAVAIDRLNELQQKIIKGLFYEEKTQEELGRELGISQRQVSRLKDKILKELGELLGLLEGEERAASPGRGQMSGGV